MVQSTAMKKALLAAATIAVLLPFAGKAFHIDDPLFVWAGRHIAEHPLDPYGFTANWSLADQPFYEITKNPPLAAYYLALAGSLFGWSEIALHLAFLLPAVAVVLGTHTLAGRLTSRPMLAALAVLLSPVFLVSATSVMCDVMMLALWIWAIVFWREGLERRAPLWLAAAGVFAAAAALTKYFGAALVPLMLAYALTRQRSSSPRARIAWILALSIPVVVLLAYQGWTLSLYGRGLLGDAVQFATGWRERHEVPLLKRGMIGLIFTGGCVLPALTFAPLLVRWRRARAAVTVPAGIQSVLFGLGGAVALSLAWLDWRRWRNPDSMLLGVWVAGTFVFASFLNWTVNGRSILPMVPAVAVLIARRLDDLPPRSARGPWSALALSGLIAVTVTWGDVRLADAQRTAARLVQQRAGDSGGSIWFQGHWGFQHYMQTIGARPFDARSTGFAKGDILVLPSNNTRVVGLPRGIGVEGGALEVDPRAFSSTMGRVAGAGFYSSSFGWLPFVFGRVPPERYRMVEIGG